MILGNPRIELATIRMHEHMSSSAIAVRGVSSTITPSARPENSAYNCETGSHRLKSVATKEGGATACMRMSTTETSSRAKPRDLKALSPTRNAD